MCYVLMVLFLRRKLSVLVVSVVLYCISILFFFKQKTAYEMRISDWSSDVCSSDLMSITLETQEQGAYVNRMYSKSGDYEAGCFRSSHFIEPDAIRPGQIGRASCRERVCQYV